MHVMIPDISNRDRQRSLGWLAVWWAETFTLIGRGDAVGQEIRHSPEYIQFIVNCYALNESGRRRFNRCQISRPKGSNKSGLAAELVLFEALGPCRFDHWAGEGETYTLLGHTYYYTPGEPVGRPVQHPEVLCLATSEGQTGNTFDSVYYNCTEGPLSLLAGEGLDAAQARIRLPEGGEVIPTTSGAASKDGGLETFVVADETHLYTTSRLKKMYQTVKRNLPKRAKASDPWLLETTTYFSPGEGSVAEETFKYAEDIREGRVKHFAGLYFDYRYSVCPVSDWSDERKLKRAIQESYGSCARSDDGRDWLFTPGGRLEPVVGDDGRTKSGYRLGDTGVEPGPSKDGWIEPEAQMAQIYQPDSDPADSTRYYLNSRASSDDSWLTEGMLASHTVLCGLVEKHIQERTLPDAWRDVISRKDEITLGFDGSVSNDSTALVGCRVSDGLLFLIRLEQKPDRQASEWRVDRDAFDAEARRMFRDYNVVGCFADAAFFESIITGWEADFGKRMRVFSRGSGSQYLMRFYTNTWKRDVYQALQVMRTNFQYELTDEERDPGAVRLLADPRLVTHFRNARMRERDFGYLIFKETPKSPKKIDACMAGLLAYTARERLLAERHPDRSQAFIPVRVR